MPLQTGKEEREKGIDVRQEERIRFEMKFAAAYEQRRDAVYGYLVYMTRDTSLAEDLSQEVFLRMFLHLDKFRGYLDFSRDEGVEYDRGILPA